MQTRPELEPVLTAAAMREADRLTIDEFGIPGFTLMETAGRAVVSAMERRYGPLRGKRVACVCGKGNNGGDGFVIARVLHARGAVVRVYATGAPDELSADARRNFDLLTGLGIEVQPADAFGTEPADLYVDALLGTGSASAPREPFASLIERMNVAGGPIVAVDIPSGLNSDDGSAPGACIRADLTVTMASLKSGLVVGSGPGRSGAVEVAEIGIPRFIIDRVAGSFDGCAHRLTPEVVKRLLPRRDHTAHKYSVGLALVVAGSPGLTGAPVMASLAAARIGSGAVVCACHPDVQPVLASKFTEVMTLGLPGTPSGGIDPAGAIEQLEPRLRQARALLIGCGLGRNADTDVFIQQLLTHVDLPVVIDADGLNALAGFPDVLARSNGRWVLTPHAGEFARLTGIKVDQSNRFAAARDFAKKWNCVLVLKGLPAIVACPDGRMFINPTGGPALATAGSGDVLAGMIVGLLAQGLSPEEAATCALYIGGMAADRYTEEIGPAGMIATDLIDRLPGALKKASE